MFASHELRESADVGARVNGRGEAITVISLQKTAKTASAQMHSDDSVPSSIVLPGLVPGIHGKRQGMCRVTWMAGSRPAKTKK
jgi:hypothetical protein